MWCWRNTEKVSWLDHERNGGVLHRDKEQRNILHRVKRRKANWILCRNCLLKHFWEGKDIEKNISEVKTRKET
jgi:hypothetical protein